MTLFARTRRAAASLETSAFLILSFAVVLGATLLPSSHSVIALSHVRLAAADLLLLFIVALVVINLVLAAPATFRRMIRRARAEAPPLQTVWRWSFEDGAISGALPRRWNQRSAARVLRGFGYSAERAGEHAVWAVKHRTAPLGFVLFQLSFVVLAVGGGEIWATRFIGNVHIAEGATFNGAFASVERHAPLGDPQPSPFVVESIDRSDPRGAVAAVRVHGPRGTRMVRSGAAAEWGDVLLVLRPDARVASGPRSVAMQVVRERGGALFVTGLVLTVLSLVWRVFATRREIVLTWDAHTFHLAGGGEFFPLRFREELEAIAAAVRTAT